MKKALLLCASHNDLGLIRALKKLEYYIIATGAVPNLIGQQYVDEYVQADYSDKELILRIATENKVDAICQCCNDFGVYTAAYVAEIMGLPGYDSYETTLTLHNKDRFKQFAKENNILSPISYSFNDKEVALKWLEEVEYPLIVKPSDCSAGNGITKIESYKNAQEALNYAFSKSRLGKIVIEPFIEGSQHGFCTFLCKRKVIAFCSNNEYSFENPFRVEIDTFPATKIESISDILIEQIEKIADILNLNDGIFHLQYILDEVGPHIIEVMRRVLGNMYSVPANNYSNFDWDYWETRAKCGISCQGLNNGILPGGYYAYKTILAPRNGIIKAINIPLEYEEYLFDKCILKQVGSEVTRFQSEPIGFLFFSFRSEDIMYYELIKNYRNDLVKMI